MPTANSFLLNYSISITVADKNIISNLFARFYYVFSGYRPKDYLYNLILGYIFKPDVYSEQDLIKYAFINYGGQIGLNKLVAIKLNKYSLIFNLYLNVVNIQED